MSTFQHKLLLVLCIVLTGSYLVEGYSRHSHRHRSKPRDRSSEGMIYGQRLSTTEFENLVSVQLKRNKQHICSGVLIDLDFLITAASCLIKNDEFYTSEEVLVIGDTTSIKRRRQQGKFRNAIAVYIHQDFDPVLYTNNIAILQIEPYDSDTLGDVLTSIIPPKPEKQCHVFGWGSGTGKYLYEAYKIPVTITSSQSCNDSFDVVNSDILCVLGDSACINGRGNLLICDDDLSGILSYGFGCDRVSEPNVYTDLSRYNGWIEDTLRGAIYGDWKNGTKQGEAESSTESGVTLPCVEAKGSIATRSGKEESSLPTPKSE